MDKDKGVDVSEVITYITFTCDGLTMHGVIFSFSLYIRSFSSVCSGIS